MRGKFGRRWLLWIAIWTLVAGGAARAQTDPLPPAIRSVPPPRPFNAPAMAPAGSNTLEKAMPYAPRPMPGPAEAGAPVGGADAAAPQGMPINLATAMQLAGVRPLDIEAATVQVRQALALQLQANALLIPTLNAGVDYFRHDGAQQNLFTGLNFRKGRQSFFVGGGPSLSVGLTDAIFNPLAARRVVDARRADVQTARNDVLLNVSQAFFELQSARGRLMGVQGRRSLEPRCWWNLRRRWRRV